MADGAKTTVVVPPQTAKEKAAEAADIEKWRKVLVWGAIVFAVFTIVFQVWSSAQTSSTTVETTGTNATTKDGTVQTTEKKGPPDVLISTLAGGAGALLVAAAFYGRIKKFSFGGAEAEFETNADLTPNEQQKVVEEASKKADAEGLQADKPAVVARALENARGAKALARSGLTSDSPVLNTDVPSIQLLTNPDLLAEYSSTAAVEKFKR